MSEGRPKFQAKFQSLTSLRTERPWALTSRSFFFSALLAITFLASCGWWRNFSTYFNILYLAQQHLEYYEDQMRDQPANSQTTGAAQALNHRWLDEEYETYQNAQRRGVPVKILGTFVKGRTPIAKSGNIVHLDSAIILGSKILANKKDTKYVEDAIFVVGKAEFYKNDFVTARRKFLELLYKYPQTKYGLEAQMFLARSMLATNQLDTAGMALREALRESESSQNPRTLADAHQALAEFIYAKNPDSLSAIAKELELASTFITGNEASRLAFESGAVYYVAGDWTSAERTFSRAAQLSKDELSEGEAKVSHALALRRLGRFAESRSELMAVATRATYSASHPTARFEAAYTMEVEARTAVRNDLRRSEFVNESFPRIRADYFTVDTTFRKESQAIVSRVNYRVAEMYREMGSFDSATRYAVPLIGTKDFSTPQFSDQVSERMRALAQFSRWRDQLHAMDSIESELSAARTRALHNAPLEQAQTEKVEIHRLALQEVLGARWRADQAPQLNADEEKLVAQAEERITKNRIAKPVYLNIGDTTRFVDSLRYTRANAHFEIGRAYENFGEIPSARDEYRLATQERFVIADTSKDLLKAQIIYGWLQLEAREKNYATRDSLLNALITFYGETAYAQQAQALYGKKRDADSPAETAYRSAYATLKNAGVENAKPSLVSLVRSYPHDDVAPRGLYAVGLAYEESVRYDSALAYYKRVLIEYPHSSYADALRPRLADATGFKAPPKQTARRVSDPAPTVKSETEQMEERQQQEIERARRERQRQLREEQEKIQNPAPPQSPMDPSTLPVPDRPPVQVPDPTVDPPGQPQDQPQQTPQSDPVPSIPLDDSPSSPIAH